jgi:voltage-gated potassium channel Kch
MTADSDPAAGPPEEAEQPAPTAAGSEPAPRPLRRRIHEQPDRYGALLVLVLVDCVVFFAAGRDGFGRAAPTVLVAVTVLFGLRTSRVHGAVVRVAQALTILLLLLLIVGGAAGSEAIHGWSAIVGAIAVGILTAAVMFRVLRHETVTLQTILGAVTVYVLFGFVFAFLEFGIGDATGRQFFAQTANPHLADYLYFSFVTLTTLGFGDLTPDTNLGRGLVSFEALLGQVFLVTLVARLVSLYGNDRRRGA